MKQEYVEKAEVLVEQTGSVSVGIIIVPPIAADAVWLDAYVKNMHEELDQLKPCGVIITFEIGIGKGPYR
jgi:hypothetical protein